MKLWKQNEEKGIVVETEKNKHGKEVIEFNHSYFQGLLMIVGQLKKLQTFCPNQYKNRLFLYKKYMNYVVLNKFLPFLTLT